MNDVTDNAKNNFGDPLDAMYIACARSVSENVGLRLKNVESMNDVTYNAKNKFGDPVDAMYIACARSVSENVGLLLKNSVGSLVVLSNENRTAQRNHPTQEFNNGVVLGAEPLRDNQLFEVKIDKKVNAWSGSIEIGVTALDPSVLNLPTSATGFRESTWVMSGCSVLRDGHTTIEDYGQDLDQLKEADRVGVLRTASGALHFYVNGVDQGQAAVDTPSTVYAIVDMYGKCAQVSVVDDSNRDAASESLLTSLPTFVSAIFNEITNEAIAEATYVHSNERLVFHERCGTLIKLTNGRRTAERKRPLDEFNNGVVMTNRPLREEEIFEIRLDMLVDKWSGSIEVGITTHNPTTLDFPATMTNMRSGTIMMSGCGILTNGKGTRREYGAYNLDELQEGDRIGLMKKTSGALHYYINGVDQGVASARTPSMVWGVVDLYGMAVKVTIIEHVNTAGLGIPNSGSIGNRINFYLRQYRDAYEDDDEVCNQGMEKLLFHTHCGSHAAVINGQRTSHRPNALDDFNNGVVLTSRTLRNGEQFEVRLDKMVDKWAGSIEIGVTTHSPLTLEFPSTMTNIRSGTWMMTGNGVMHNGTTIIDAYGQNLDGLTLADRVGVSRKEDGTLHFTVNGVDQGQAATNVPAAVYGVIDLYGQAAQATIIDQSDPTNLADIDTCIDENSDELGFHHRHGHNAIIMNNGKTAARPNARGEFNDAIVTSNRPLKDNELFEVTIDKMVDRWSGSIEAGVTLILPEQLDFPNTMTDIDHDTWMLSGSAIMQDGSTTRNRYSLDLDLLTVRSRVGMMRCSDGTLHYFLDGIDQGVAGNDIPSGVYAVIDLYGQCAQVTITGGSGVRPPDNHLMIEETDRSLSSPLCSDTDLPTIPVCPEFIRKYASNDSIVAREISHRFSQCCGKNITLRNNGCIANRVRHFNGGLVFSADPLRSDELFEVRVESLSRQWSGSLQIGLTTMAISDSTPVSLLPLSACELTSKVTWVISGSEVKKNGITIKENYTPSLDRLEVNDRVGVKRGSDGSMRVYINGDDVGVAASNIPKNVFALIDLYGRVESVAITSSAFSDVFNSSQILSIITSTSSRCIEDEQDLDTAEVCHLEFHTSHGKNIELTEGQLTARRMASYNQGIVLSHKPLPRNHMFKVRIDRLNTHWTSSLSVGVLAADKFSLAVSAVSLKQPCWVVQDSSVFHSGIKVKDHFGSGLDSLQVGDTVGLMVSDETALHLYINGVDQGIITRDVPLVIYALVDLYGQCEQVTLVTDDDVTTSSLEHREKADMEDGMKEKGCHCPEVNVIKNCEYQNLCSRFQTTLGLPEGYLNPQFNRCYCELCHKIRGDEPLGQCGDPPREYSLPFGWCKFGLRLPPKASVLNVLEKWHVAFHGTNVAHIRKILDTGDLILPGDAGMVGSQAQASHFDENNKPVEQCDIEQVVFSPSIRYAGSHSYTARYEYRDPKTRKTHSAMVAFQVCVKPGSYKVGVQTVGANEDIDPRFRNTDLEWSTKERGATVLCALLIKVEQ
ncbi:Neuralized-like protein 4 [Lamellibrachia satsuma]|nr:Neuralized-like protein 4 [Lamellibrachia satsuma]